MIECMESSMVKTTCAASSRLACERAVQNLRNLWVAICVCAAGQTASGQFPVADEFNPALSGEVRSLAVQTDGKILLGGNFGPAGSNQLRLIARVNPQWIDLLQRSPGDELPLAVISREACAITVLAQLGGPIQSTNRGVK
jgi:hypothetical protein